MEKGGMTLRTRMRKANTGTDQGEARPCLYCVQNIGQGLGQTLVLCSEHRAEPRPDSQVLVFTSLTRFSSLSNFAISTAGPFCTSCPFFS